MRAVMAVLRAAASLKQMFPDANEGILMLRHYSDLFPGIKLPEPDYVLLKETCAWHCKNDNLQLTELFFIKIT
eukprot:jgi/Chrpa1/20793/Chrysochromulina_OHIO_Genome00022770-RA